MMRKYNIAFVIAIYVVLIGCRNTKNSAKADCVEVLTDSITKIVSEYPGEIGVSVIVNNRDTIAINNENKYPMMSVFKLHQAIALCDMFDHAGTTLDTIINIKRNSLDPNTWSPMLKDYTDDEISISVRDLLRYTLMQSDNNASNLMFKSLNSVAETDSMIATIIPRETFQIVYSEEEMSDNHKNAYSNCTSPLGAVMLINRLFTDSIISNDKQEFIKSTLAECQTGQDRIAAPIMDKEGVILAHKTGSGYRENGVLAAHNDVGYITLPNGATYSLAVFVKDFRGDEAEASKVIAKISAIVYDALSDILE